MAKTLDQIKSNIITILNSEGAFPELTKDKDMYVILVNGKRLKTFSGKSVWPSIGAAKNALNNHLYALYADRKFHLSNHKIHNEDGVLEYNRMKQAKTDAENEWIKQHVVFVPFDQYMIARKKRK